MRLPPNPGRTGKGWQGAHPKELQPGPFFRCQRAVLTVLSSHHDLDGLAAKRDAVFKNGRKIPFVQDGVIALAVDLFQGFSGEFFQLGRCTLLCRLELDQDSRQFVVSGFRRQAQIVPTFSGFKVGSNLEAVIHDRAEAKHESVVEVFMCRIKRAHGDQKEIPQSAFEHGRVAGIEGFLNCNRRGLRKDRVQFLQDFLVVDKRDFLIRQGQFADKTPAESLLGLYDLQIPCHQQKTEN